MLFRLILLFTIVPLIELIILIKIGEIVGIIPTITLVILTGILGAALAKSQGILIIGKIRNELNTGQIPAENMLNGLLVLIGGIVLLTPGLLTDILGFILLIPVTRNMIKKILRSKFRDYIDKNTVTTTITIN